MTPRKAGREARAHGLHRTGIPVRVVALVAVPLTALGVMAATVVGTARSDATAAAEVKHAVADVVALAELVEALGAEQAGARTRAFDGPTGVGPAGPTSRTLERRRATDEALDAARLRGRVGPRLALLRAALDDGGLPVPRHDAIFGAISVEVRQQLIVRSREVRRQAAAIDGGVEVAEALDVLAAVGQALHARSAQLAGVGPFVLGTPSERERARVDLGIAHAELGHALGNLPARTAAAFHAGWQRLHDPQLRQILGEVMAVVHSGGDPEGHLTGDDVAALAQAALRLQQASHQLVVDAVEAAEGAAADLQAAAEDRYRSTALTVVGATALTLLLAGALARSLTRPLRDVSRTAAAVGEGELDVAELVPRGPRGVRLVAAAFNDLVGNLRLLEAKSQALARLDLADPVLDVPLPGRLGQSIQASVSLLSGSIEERNELQRTLAHQATHDALTGLINRPSAILSLEKALARGRRAGEPVAVLAVDLDGFKVVNDTHGHDVGDRVLAAAGVRLQQVVRDGDLVARLGADEFLVVAERACDVDASALARRIVEVLAEPMDIGTRRLVVGASVGVALSLDGTGEALDMLARADMALQRAKARGVACVELYDRSLQQELLRRSEVEGALSATLARGGEELHLLFQPVVDAERGDVRAAEALIRWERPGKGQVFPDEFIPVAEASDLIIDLDVWVLRTACRHAVGWAAAGCPAPPSVSVNVSGRHLLSERLFDNVRAVLDETGLDPRRLVLEVTETVLLTDIPTAASQLEAIRALGVRVAVDDFGTGYTSLAMLEGLPVDVIKVDRSFVAGIHENRQRSLVSLVTQLGHQLNLVVVAEGVETDAQRDAVRALGCDEIQGYLVSRPVPEPDLRARFVLSRS